MLTIRSFLNRINSFLNPAPLPSPITTVTPPIPVPAPSATAPVAVIPVLPLLDSRAWKQENPGWLWEGTRMEYAGNTHSILRSPSRDVPASKKVTIAATMACDSWGMYKASGHIGISAYNSKGNHVYSTRAESITDGPNVVVAEFPDTAATYVVNITAYIQYAGGTNDTQLLKVRFVNLCSSDVN